jgi:hypothetical protein
MSISLAITNLVSVIEALTWVTDAKEVEQDPGSQYTVYLLPDGATVLRDMTRIKSVAGKLATGSNVFAKMQALEDAIEADRRRDGNAQTTYIGEEWELVEEFKQGYSAFEVPVSIDIHI